MGVISVFINVVSRNHRIHARNTNLAHMCAKPTQLVQRLMEEHEKKDKVVNGMDEHDVMVTSNEFIGM